MFFFSLLGDETKDVSKVEQLAIVIWYVDMQYMSDFSRSGVQTRIREKAPQALYVHCNAHCLNLCHAESTEFFILLETVFLSSSKCHTLFMEKQKELKPGKQLRRLQKLSDTRWACRQGSVNAICCTYDAVVATLSAVANGNDGTRPAEAKGLLYQVNSFSFLVLSLIGFFLLQKAYLMHCRAHSWILQRQQSLFLQQLKFFRNFDLIMNGKILLTFPQVLQSEQEEFHEDWKRALF